MGPIESLDALLTQHVAAIHGTARHARAGGDEAWDALLGHYGIAPFDARERALIVQHMGLARGATPAEVRVVLQGLQRWAEHELARSSADPTLAGSPSLAGLAARVAALADRETDAYERMLGLPPPPPPAPAPAAPAPAAPSLASIFANAQQTSKEVPWAGQQYRQVNHLTCVHCGGPQEQPMDFMCRYCRRPIAGTLSPTQ
ncbi:MAG: hypothetical protein U0263_31175 [Polyangiaceae bacterium]